MIFPAENCPPHGAARAVVPSGRQPRTRLLYPLIAHWRSPCDVSLKVALLTRNPAAAKHRGDPRVRWRASVRRCRWVMRTSLPGEGGGDSDLKLTLGGLGRLSTGERRFLEHFRAFLGSLWGFEARVCKAWGSGTPPSMPYKLLGGQTPPPGGCYQLLGGLERLSTSERRFFRAF